MFALKKKVTSESGSNTNTQVARTAAGMFFFFAVLRAAPWIIGRLRA